MSKAYYNEYDPKAAATLRELIACKLIADGDVDERSIEDVRPADLRGYTQVHLFAGFGIWSLAFRMAGWPDSRPVWSASCPCQPFSQAGKGGGFADDRHLWPSAFWLLQHGKPSGVRCYGEQVASPDGLSWLDLVRADLETIDHSCWSTVLASAGFGAPIIRQRTYWMACSERSGCECVEVFNSSSLLGTLDAKGIEEQPVGSCCSSPSRMACSNSQQYDGRGEFWERRRSASSDRRDDSGLDISDDTGCEGRFGVYERSDQFIIRPAGLVGRPAGTGPTNGFWGDADWLLCRDGKWRPVEPGAFPLVNGYPERMGILRGAGNAISPQVAEAWIRSTM